MITLEQIKNDYSVSKGYKSWFNLLSSALPHTTKNRYINEVMRIYAMECLKLASENVNLKKYNSDKFGHKYSDGLVDGVSLQDGSLYEVNKDSITNENNIVK